MAVKRTAIITGATRGIGRGLFQRLAKSGVNIATLYHEDVDSANRFELEAKEIGVEYLIEKMDITDFENIPIFIGKVLDKFGSIDYLISNVGVDIWGNIVDLSLEEWEKSQDVILNAPFVFCKNVIPIMRKQKFGRIINIGASSKNYMTGTLGMAPFSINKAALNIFTKTLALEEMKYGITVNMVAPGSTRDAGINPEEGRIPISQIPIGRRVEIDEVVDAIMYFLSDSANSVTGQFIGVNGGLST